MNIGIGIGLKFGIGASLNFIHLTYIIQGLSEVVHFSKRQLQYQDVIKFYQTRVIIIQKGLPFDVRSLEIYWKAAPSC